MGKNPQGNGYDRKVQHRNTELIMGSVGGDVRK